MSKANLNKRWKRNLDEDLSRIIAQQVEEFSHVVLPDQQASEHCIVMNVATFKEARKRLWKNQPIPEDRRYRGALVIVIEYLEHVVDGEGAGEFTVDDRKPLEDGDIKIIKFSDPRMHEALRRDAPTVMPRRIGIIPMCQHQIPEAERTSEHKRGIDIRWYYVLGNDVMPVDGWDEWYTGDDITLTAGENMARIVFVEGHFQPQVIKADEGHEWSVLPVADCDDCKGLYLTYNSDVHLDVTCQRNVAPEPAETKH